VCVCVCVCVWCRQTCEEISHECSTKDIKFKAFGFHRSTDVPFASASTLYSCVCERERGREREREGGRESE
jgi:hypothetical protein